MPDSYEQPFGRKEYESRCPLIIFNYETLILPSHFKKPMATTTDDAALKPDPAILAKVKPAPFERRPLVENQRDSAWITDKICRIVEEKTPAWWWVCFAVAALTASFTVMGLVYLVSTGVGVLGLGQSRKLGLGYC